MICIVLYSRPGCAISKQTMAFEILSDAELKTVDRKHYCVK